MPRVTVAGVPSWVDARQLLGEGDWALQPDTTWAAELDRSQAADLAARLRGLGMGGQPFAVDIVPPLKRKLVRDARTVDARRRRDTTPGFLQRGVRLDEEGRRSLTPEALALTLGEAAHRAGLRTVVDAFGGAGGNAIGFARAGCEVHLIERDRARADDAAHNASRYGVADRITVHAADALDRLPTLSADLLFLDPPWGEVDRKVCGLGDLPLLERALRHADGFAHVWCKLPPSFDPATLPGFRAEAVFGRATGDARRVKFAWLRRP